MNKIFQFKPLILSTLLALCSHLIVNAQAMQNHITPAAYMGGVIGRKFIYKSIDGNGKRRHHKVRIECQDLKDWSDHRELIFVRTGYDEPIVLEVYDTKINDTSLGGVLLKAEIRNGDVWENVGKKTGRLVSTVEVVSVGVPLEVSGVRYENCIVLMVRDVRSRVLEKRVYALGVGLVKEETYADPQGAKIENTIELESYSDHR